MKTHSILHPLFALALLAMPAAVQAQASVSISGGANAPVGTLGDIADIGYNIAAGINLGGTAVPVGLRIEGAYNGLNLKNSGGDVRIISGAANAIFNVGKASDAPYLIAGLGAYNRQLNFNALVSGKGKTVAGMNVGGGLRFPLVGLSTFFEARYHVMLGSSADAANYQFIPITFGIVF